MESLEGFIKSINFHSIVHLALCAVSSILAILLGIILEKWPLISTLTAISIITLVSGITGMKLSKETKRSLIRSFFVLQIILLCAWDFGGVICVISIVLDYQHESKAIFVGIVFVSCFVYIAAFVYFWKSFIVVNRLMVFLNNKNKYKSAGLRNAHYDAPDRGTSDATDKSANSHRSRTLSRQMKEKLFTAK